ncbi:hypothetical protein SAMN05421594_1925 [Chryseobacterium oleae]|uniref:Uncharacterized protein n=2 Tax=Chryseobacterium oleae TaxID=491207 RepID=A0A1I4XMD8_CHROL|nr:hypothetical protein SAMN05421594_1925 [Chryseobacterium oleae]
MAVMVGRFFFRLFCCKGLDFIFIKNRNYGLFLYRNILYIGLLHNPTPMKKIYFFLVLLIFQVKAFGQNSPNEEFQKTVTHWFSAWILVYQNIYKIDTITPVEFVFFDENYVYSTSTVTINKGETINGPSLLNLKLNWKKALHHGTITLPNKNSIPVGITSYASEIPDTAHHSFFVMPLPSFWKKAGVESKELGLDNLITGVFLHEFSHSQQMLNFGIKITQYEKEHNFGVNTNDDMLQNIFSQNKAYVDLFNTEVSTFYNSISNKELDQEELLKGLNLMDKRQKKYLKGKYKTLAAMDDLFLTMEGLGQYSMYLWLIHPEGGSTDLETAIKGVRRNGRWWSQEEGLVLFLILERQQESAFWVKDMFGTKSVTIMELIRSNLKK